MNEICYIAGYVPNGVVPPKDGWGDYLRKLDDFLKISDMELLTHAGIVSAEVAKLKADYEV